MKFGGNKFELNHSFIFLNTQFKFCSKPVTLGLPTIMTVSSASKMVLKLIFKFSKFVILVRLLIYSKKIKGRSIDPCSMPYLMVTQLEILF